ncbi:MAG: amino acid-binding domain protein [Gammaproteobacteria bacterium]|jgi:glycine cleavage system transcriptional repressor|nr:amino acid-binding domain protein [Gammaproteobacteria bacterium]
MKNNSLSIILLCPDRVGVIPEITQATYRAGCSIETTQMKRLGNLFAANILVTGNWSTIAKLEAELNKLRKKEGYHIIASRTENTAVNREALPFTVQVLGKDESSMVYQIANFFAEQGLSINELTGYTYTAKHTQTPMFSLHLSVNIPTDQHIADVREQFILFCDEYNWDGIIEPEHS